MKHNYYLSYSKDGAAFAEKLHNILAEKGYSSFYNSNFLGADSFFSSISDTIKNCDYFVPIITESYLSSSYVYEELMQAVDAANGRGREIIPIVLCAEDEYEKVKHNFVDCYHLLVTSDSKGVEEAAALLDKKLRYNLESAELYEKLTEYNNLKLYVKATQTVSSLVSIVCNKWKISTNAKRRQLIPELCRLLHQLEYHSCGWNQESRSFGYSLIGTAQNAASLMNVDKFDTNIFLSDLFFTSFAIRVLYYEREISTEGVDLGTGGDVFTGALDPFPISKYIEKQKPYVEAFEKGLAQINDKTATSFHFSEEELEFIKQTPSFIFGKSPSTSNKYSISVDRETAALTEEEEILLSVANFMHEGNKLLDVLQSKGIAGDFLKCLLTSYERLKNYCQIVGANNVAADCVDRIVEIRDQILKQDSSSTNNEKVENGIKSLLGFTLNTGNNYDVFISFKDADSDLAEKIYRLCQKNLKVPFWSKRSLPELSQSEYEKAIYQALDRSTHFVVVLSKLEYLYADWIQEEMSVFHREKSEGRKDKKSNFVFVLTDDLYKQIIGNNKKDISIEYRGYQIVKMSEYESLLLQYIN